jgi:hypothetical protein
VTPSYKCVDTGAAAIFDNQMTQAAGALDSGIWNQAGDKTAFAATGSTFTIPYGDADADADVRAAPINVSLPSDYWVETKARITDTTDVQQEVLLAMLGATPSPYFGSAVHVEVMRTSSTGWRILARDDFDWVFTATIGSGRDLTNTWVYLALKKEGTKVTVYYRINADPAPWIPIGKWTTSKTGAGFAIATWKAGAEFDYLVARPLKTVTG